MSDEVTPGVDAPEADAPTVTVEDSKDVEIHIINGFRQKKAKIEYTRDGANYWIVAKTRAKYGTIRSLADEDKLPAAFCELVLEHNLVDLDTGEDLPNPLTVDRFPDIEFGLVAKLVRGIVEAINKQGN